MGIGLSVYVRGSLARTWSGGGGRSVGDVCGSDGEENRKSVVSARLSEESVRTEILNMTIIYMEASH